MPSASEGAGPQVSAPDPAPALAAVAAREDAIALGDEERRSDELGEPARARRTKAAFMSGDHGAPARVSSSALA